MKILQVMAGNTHGGAETAFVDTCLAMHEAGMAIEVATRPNEGRVPALERAGIRVHTLPFGGPLDLYTRWKLGRIIHDFSPQIVQTWMARAAQKTPNWKDLKTPERYLVVSRLGGYYKVKNFKSADYFTTITPDIKRHLVEGGIEANRVRVVHNFAETEKDAKPVQRSDLNTPEDAPVLLALGRLHSAKAHDILIKAASDMPGIYVWIAGEGPERANLEKVAEDLGMAGRVKFLGWRNDRSALLRACDICCFISRVEPFGTVFAQAWAEKTPVIVSDADGPKQFCRDGEDCLMVPKENPQAVKEAVTCLLADKDLQQKLIANGHARYLAEFTKEATIGAYRQFFQEALGQHKIAV
jgi:glycosyltransferase involved in cell wall biosynthesis